MNTQGLRLVDEIAPQHMSNEAKLLAALDPAAIAAREATLRRLLSSLEQGQPPPSRQG